MSIKQIETSKGPRFRVNVMARSKIVPRLRVDLQSSSSKSFEEAKRVEKRLLRDAERKLLAKEQSGLSWELILRDWELAIREGRGISRSMGKATIHDYVAALHLYTSDWYKRPVEEITAYDLQIVLDDMKLSGKSNSRMRAIVNAINHIWRWASVNGYFQKPLVPPTKDIAPISRAEYKKPEILTLNEIKKLLDAAFVTRHPWRHIWAFALHTGGRSGELLELRWTDVDWENERLTFARSYNRRYNLVKETKGGYWREVPINSELMSLLKDLKASANGSPHVLPRFEAWVRGDSATVLRTFCRGIGVPSVKFHTLRACFATQLLRDKIAPAIVMKICGWRDLKTMQRYVRLAGIEIEGATDNLKIMPEKDVAARVVELYSSNK